MNQISQIIEHPRFLNRSNEYIRWYPKTLLPLIYEPDWKAVPLRGAYIHVPFCDQICKFCPYNKIVTQKEIVGRFVKALEREIQLLSERILSSEPLSFIYFGGGTPSVLEAPEISGILEQLDKIWGLASNVEITLETHPIHANQQYLKAIAATGVNRISMGIQSFHQDLLSALGSTHNANDSRNAVESACAVFDNVAIDLLYNYQPQTKENWREELKIAIREYNIPHLSCYALVPIGTNIEQPTEENEIELAIEALEFCQSFGLNHYASCASGGFDVSKSEKKCRYEVEHWSAPQYNFVGLGPGAFGFAGGHSTVNRLSVERYCSLSEEGYLPLASAVPVNEEELRHRYFVLGIKGLEVPFAPYRAIFGREPLKDFAEAICILEQEKLATVVNDSLQLTPVGRLYVDSCSTLFFSEFELNVPHPEEPEIRSIEKQLKNKISYV
jgi:oxygen-independent coproporphyrinogen-3 oxidase